MELSMFETEGGCAVSCSSSFGVRFRLSAGVTWYSGSLLARCLTFT